MNVNKKICLKKIGIVFVNCKAKPLTHKEREEKGFMTIDKNKLQEGKDSRKEKINEAHVFTTNTNRRRERIQGIIF